MTQTSLRAPVSLNLSSQEKFDCSHHGPSDTLASLETGTSTVCRKLGKHLQQCATDDQILSTHIVSKQA